MTRTRSRSYPAIALQDAYQILRERLGILKQQGARKRQEMAALLGYSSTSGGLGVRKIAALVGYGILEKRKDGYGLSTFGEYLYGLEPQGREWPAAIGTAFFKPSLFEDLIRTYQACGRLPKNLPEVLEEQFQIAHNASAVAARIFLKSGQFAGVLDGHSIRAVGVSAEVEKPESQDASASVSESGEERPEPAVSSHFGLTGTKRAYFSLELPNELNENDYSLIQKHLAYWASHYASLQQSQPTKDAPEPLPFRGRRGLSSDT